MMIRYIVDRIEGEYAICECEDETRLDILLKDLPNGVKEGSIIVLENGVYSLAPNEEVEALRKKNIDLQNSLFE